MPLFILPSHLPVPHRRPAVWQSQENREPVTQLGYNNLEVFIGILGSRIFVGIEWKIRRGNFVGLLLGESCGILGHNYI